MKVLKQLSLAFLDFLDEEESKKSHVTSKYLCIFFNTPFELTIYSYHFTYAFQSESTIYICLNVKELFARNGHDI